MKKGLLVGFVLFALMLFLPIGTFQIRACLGIVLLAGTLWVSEALPLFVTSLLIAVLLPILQVTNAENALKPFFSPIIGLIFGGFLLARAVEKHGLGRRITYGLISAVGTDSRLLLLAMMFTTAILSSFVSNSAATALMLPVAISVLKHIRADPLKSRYGIAVMLGLAYSANIGGTMSLIGSPPNLIAAHALESIGYSVSFLDWMTLAAPFGFVMLLLTWSVLLRLHPPEIHGNKKFIKDCRSALEDLGPLVTKERRTFLVFLSTIMLWLTESVHNIHYGIVALIAVVLLYSLELLDDKDLKNLDWGTLLLFGGGLSLGAAMASSGTAKFLVEGIFTGVMPDLWLVLASIAVVTMILTNIASNTASTAILIPIVVSFANSFSLDPAVLALTTGICASFTFVLPVGTPPNAIVFGSGYLRMKDMIRTGLVLSALTLPVLLMTALLYWSRII